VLGSGQGLWVRGHNGVGKTTLLRTVAGLCPPHEGECWRRPGLELVYLGHRNGLKDELTVLQSAQLMAALQGKKPEAGPIREALCLWELWHRRHQPLRSLSQGLRRRVALLRLQFSSEHALWLLDEPADALDVQGMSLLCQRLRRHREGGGAWLLTSHVPLFGGDDPALPELHLGSEVRACG
jgi:heme exporter protein A